MRAPWRKALATARAETFLLSAALGAYPVEPENRTYGWRSLTC